MPRILDVLEQESRTVDLEQGDFERLLVRRERQQRNRRLRAGAVGVIVALAMGLAFVRSLTSDPIPAVPPNPAPLGAGEVLTRMKLQTGKGLVAQDPDSGEVRMIVDAKSLPELLPRYRQDITSAAWSPGHDWVAFRRGQGSMAGNLWVADTIGGAPRMVAEAWGYSPWAWSPTEDELVVVRGHDVTLIDAATGSEAELGTAVGAKNNAGEVVHTLMWSPDGSRIVYDGGPRSGSVYSIDVESGEHSLLLSQPAGFGRIGDIDWSPDGAHLAISYASSPGYKAQVLYLANADGSGLRFLDRLSGYPSWWSGGDPGHNIGRGWSPDGTRLAYAIQLPDPEGSVELQVWTVSVDGSAPSLVASQCCASDGGSPVWSPDGSQIAFEAEYGGGKPNVRLGYLVVNADGSGDPREIGRLTYRSWLGGLYSCLCYG